MAQQDELPVKVVIIPPSAAEVSRSMASIEAAVEASGRRIGQARSKGSGDSLAVDKQMTRAFVGQLKIREQAKKASTARMRAIDKQMTSAFIGELKRRSIAAKIEAKKAQEAAFARSSEGIFKAAGIKGTDQRIREVNALKRAQVQLRRELRMGKIGLLQYKTMLHDTHKQMNLLTRGNVRARGAFHQLIARVASLTFELTGAVFGLVTMGAALASPAILGVGFLRKMEDTKLGITGIMLAMGAVNGEALNFATAAQVADEQINKLSVDSLLLAGTLEDFTRSFQAVLAPGLAAGMTLDEIRKISVAGTVAVKTIGLDSRQIVQEIRDLVAGGIQAASSTLATSLGLTDRDIKAAKASTEGLFVFLTDKLEGFRQAGLERDKTLSGKMEQTWEVFIKGLGEASEPVFESLKGLFDDILGYIVQIDEATGKIKFDELTGKLQFNEAFITGAKTYVGVIADVLDGIKQVIKFMIDWKDIILTLIALKVGNAVFGSLITGAVKYGSALLGVIATQKIFQKTSVTSAAAASNIFGPQIDKKTLAFRKIFSGGVLRGLFTGAGKIALAALGPAGLIGTALWGIHTAFGWWKDYTDAPLNDAKKKISETKEDFIKEFSDMQKSIGQKIVAQEAKLQEARAGLKKAEEIPSARERKLIVPRVKEQVLASAEALEILNSQYEALGVHLTNLGKSTPSVSDSISRMDGALKNAQKALQGMNNDFSKGFQEAEKNVQVFNIYSRLTKDFIEFQKQEGKGTEEQIKKWQNRNAQYKEAIVLINKIRDSEIQLQALEIAAKTAPAGRARDEAKDELARFKAIIKLRGQQASLELFVGDIKKELSKKEDAFMRKQLVNAEKLLATTKAQIVEGQKIDTVTAKQEQWNKKLQDATEISKDYVTSLKDTIAQRELEFEFAGEQTTEVEKIQALIAHKKELVKIERKYNELLLAKNKEGYLGDEVIADQRKADIEAANEALINFNNSIDSLFERQNEWSAGAKESFKAYISAAENSAEQARGFFSSAFSALEDDLMNFFKTGERAFENFVQTILDGLLRIQIQRVIAGLLPGFTGVTEIGGGAAAPTPTPQTFAAAHGAGFDRSGLIAFARGGVVQTPTIFPFARGTGLMGEAGPEAIMPLSRTTSGDLGVKVSGDQGGTVNQINVEVNINNDGTSETNVSGTEASGKNVGNALGQVVQAEIVKQMRPGGLLSKR